MCLEVLHPPAELLRNAVSDINNSMVPHHGGDMSLTTPFLEAVNPRLAIISVGADNRFGHPDQAALDKLEEISTYRTDQQGTIEVVGDGVRY
jgi:competence protein ComEC